MLTSLKNVGYYILKNFMFNFNPALYTIGLTRAMLDGGSPQSYEVLSAIEL